jgi:hypothetical protein
MQHSLMRDEKAEAEFVIKNGFTDGFSFGEALSVAKYYRQVYKWGDVRVKKGIVSFIKDNDSTFNEIRNRNTIALLVKYSRKTSLVDKTSPIYIRENELKIIRSIRDYKLQKIGFAILVIAKRDRNNGIVNKTRWAEIKEAIASLKVTDDDVYECFRYFYSNGLATVSENYPKRYESYGYHTLLFLDDISPVVIKFTSDKDVRSLSKFYNEYCGGDLGYCKKCGKEFFVVGKNHNYCDKCSKEKELGRKRDWKNTKYKK